MLFSLISVLFAFSIPFLTEKNGDPFIDHLSRHEKFYLNKYFEYLIRYEHVGHVLFLDKPVAYASFPVKGIKSYPVNCIARGWHIWNKYKDTFPHPNYIIISEISENKFNSGIDVCELFIINKSALYEVLVDNEGFFKKKLGANFSPDQFIEALECRDSAYSIMLASNSALGVMLGYGVDSSIYFENGNRNPKDAYGEVSQLMSIAPVRFVFDPNSNEAQVLVDKYESEITKLRAIYRDRNFFERSMKQLSTVPNSSRP